MIEVQGRKISICDDTWSQSVNLCTPANTEGEYEQVFYFAKEFRVTQAQVEERSDLTDLTTWLRRRSGEQARHWGKQP